MYSDTEFFLPIRIILSRTDRLLPLASNRLVVWHWLIGTLLVLVAGKRVNVPRIHSGAGQWPARMVLKIECPRKEVADTAPIAIRMS